MIEDFKDRGIYLTEDEYRTGLRALFPEDYQELSDEELEDIIYDKIAQMSPFEAEGFFSSIGNFVKNKVAPVALGALPVAATVAGTVFGGPAGSALGGAAGKLAAGAIGKAAHIRPNQTVANIGQAASAISSGNYRAAIPAVINVGRNVGNAVSRGAGNKFANVASNVAQAGSAIASGNYGAAISGGINAGREVGNAISHGAGNRFANVASNVVRAGTGIAGNLQDPTQATTKLLSFLKSTPFLQSMLSSIATGNLGNGLQMLKEDGSTTTTNYMEMLEVLKDLTENAIAEADNAGASPYIQIESEADRDAYLESVLDEVSAYENALLPNYDNITY